MFHSLVELRSDPYCWDTAAEDVKSLKQKWKKIISELPCTSVAKRVSVQNLSYENKFDLHENEPVGGTRFHVNSV